MVLAGASLLMSPAQLLTEPIWVNLADYLPKPLQPVSQFTCSWAVQDTWVVEDRAV